MRPGPVFADAFYWVGLLNPDDQWHEPVRRMAARLGRRRILTTEEVLLEVMAALGGAPHVHTWVNIQAKAG